MVRAIPALCVLAFLAVPAHAGVVYEDFGTLSGATFNGTGIPNDAVAISQVTAKTEGGIATVTLGLTAHARFAAPPVTNDGAATFTALAGTNLGTALWNVGFYVDIEKVTGDQLSFADLTFHLLYDFNPVADNDSDLGDLNLNDAAVALGANLSTLTHAEDSENMTFGFFSTPSTFVTPPTYPSAGSPAFDPNAIGEYQLFLTVSQGNDELARVGILVDTVSAVPEPASLVVFGTLLVAGLVPFGRRRLASAAA